MTSIGFVVTGVRGVKHLNFDGELSLSVKYRLVHLQEGCESEVSVEEDEGDMTLTCTGCSRKVSIPTKELPGIADGVLRGHHSVTHGNVTFHPWTD